MEELKPTTIEQEAVIDTITENAPKAKKSLGALGIVLITLCVALIATAVFVGIKIVPGILMKMSVLNSARDSDGGTDYLYVLAKEYPYSNNVFTLDNGIEISNEYFSMVIPKEMEIAQQSEYSDFYTVSDDEGNAVYALSFEKKLMGIGLGDPSDIEKSVAEIDALFIKHFGKPFPRTFFEINELLYSYTPNDFNIWDKEQCVAMSTIMTWKSTISSATEFYTYNKDGVIAEIEVWAETTKTSYIISVYDMQTETSCRFMFFDKSNQNSETIFKIINSIKLKQG